MGYAWTAFGQSSRDRVLLLAICGAGVGHQSHWNRYQDRSTGLLEDSSRT